MNRSGKETRPTFQPTRPLPPAAARTAIALFIPPVIGAILATVAQNLLGAQSSTLALPSVFLGGIGLASIYLGMNWYGAAGLGLRGARPFFAGAGFAFLGWIAVLTARFFLGAIDESRFLQQPLLPSFIYLLFFEAFALQLWTFGLLFRGAADWRGPLTAAIVGGLTFAAAGFLVFQESFQSTWQAAVYFFFWGLFYGIVRLRTGSLIGVVLIQATQSLTAWFLLPPIRPVTAASLNPLFYIYLSAWYLLLLWRLWPKEESDYRV